MVHRISDQSDKNTSRPIIAFFGPNVTQGSKKGNFVRQKISQKWVTHISKKGNKFSSRDHATIKYGKT